MRKYAALAVTAAAVALGAAGGAQGARHDILPLHPGSAGPRVCALQWLLGGHRPSVWRSTRFTVYKGRPTCWWAPKSSRTTKALRTVKYWLGYPLSSLDDNEAGPAFFAIMQGQRRRPAGFIGRAAARAHPASLAPSPGYPLGSKATICGVPGVGTHSYIATPNNWQSDRALDLCVAAGTAVLAVHRGTICEGCGFGYFAGAGGGRFAGQRFTLNATTGDQLYYAHLSSVRIHRGEQVDAAVQLGLSGVANGVAHLHIACRVCNPYSLAQ